MRNIIEQSFGINISILHFVGLYPSKSYPKLQKLKGKILYFTMLIMVVAIITIKIFSQQSVDILQMNYMMVFLAATIPFCFKFMPFIIDSEKISKCVDYFGQPHFAPKEEKERIIVEQCIQVCRMMSRIYTVFIAIAEIYWNVPPLLERRFPLDVWLPFDPFGRILYYPIFTYLGVASVYCGFCGTLIDPLIGGLAFHATAQLKILKLNLQQIGNCSDERCQKNHNNYYRVVFKNVTKKLRQCVIHHNYILEFVSEYENCFSLCIFSQVAGCTFGLCFCCIGMLLSSSSFLGTIKNATYCLVFSTQILFYCFFGTLLYEENSTLIEAIYMSQWYRYDVQTRKVLIFLMERSKRPMILRAGKIVDLTLQTFTSFLKTSYSLMAVLNKY